MQGAEDSLYARQLSGGFPTLNFEPPLERDFRAHYTARTLRLRRSALLLVLLFMGALALLDWRIQPSAFSTRAIGIRLGLIAPVLLGALLATYPGMLARFVGRLTVCATAVLGAGSVVVLGFAVQHGVSGELVSIAVITAATYLIFGLRFFTALGISLTVLVASLMTGVVLGQPGERFFYETLALVAVNVVAGFACYRLEHSARTIFLEREIANLLAGSDALTGIPNRRLFNSHLQSVRRQAERESRGIAVGLMEVDYLDAFRSRYGIEAADTCLRRVAHAILRCARRPLDLAARFSGDELSMVLYDPGPAYVDRLVRRIRDSVAVLDIPHDASPVSERVTVSVGVALSPAGDPQSAQSLLELADDALQEAKDQGRNRIVLKERPGSKRGRVFRGPWLSTQTD